ncbi:MAG: AGE family epimerase/isomerase, partial [Pseudomonadota bacterium]|nr:AGE family epimerase/isomerase [Pseudomonadota bacterium]
MTNAQPILPANGMNWRSNRFHRQWLFEQATNLFDFFQHSIINPVGGFFDLDDAGQPIETANPVRQIHNTTRMVHCFAIGTLLGRPGCDAIVDHGMNYLWHSHRDAQHGGYVWSLDDNGP